MQEEAWTEYKKITRKWLFPDVLLVNGDAIEGNQSKQGGAELITTDRNVQCDMAVEAIKALNASQVLMTYGSKYHVSDSAEDFEYAIAGRLQAKIGGRLYFKIEGMTLDARHKIGVSSLPQGRATALLKEMAWNLIKSADNQSPKVNVVIRSHTHYHIWIEQPNRVMFTTPSLQLSRGRYGSRECVGETHWGMMRLIIKGKEIIERNIVCKSLVGNKPQIIKVR